MSTQGLTLLAAIEPGQEEALRATLQEIGDDINGRRLGQESESVHINFPRSRAMHFARLVVLPDPDTGPDACRLLLATDYDGSLESHLREIVELTSDLDAVFGRCVGYQGKDRFAEFVRAHSLEPDAYYIAFRGQSVEDVRRLGEIRRQVEERLDSGEPPERAPLGLHMWLTVAAALGTIGKFVGRTVMILVDVVIIVLRFGPLTALRAAKQIGATLDRLWYGWLFNRLTWNSFSPPSTPYTELDPEICGPCVPQAPGDEVVGARDGDPIRPPKEDVITQNQLTLVTVIDPARVREARAVQAVIELYARRLAAPGSLAGISTIHFVRWLIIDGGKRLVMLSNYDGSWDAYIDEFAVMILSGLDAIWGSAVGYPTEGAQDLPAFKRFLRCHQTQSQVFYSAYPWRTVVGINDDRAMARSLGRMPR